MSYVKLCQIVQQTETDVQYLEDCNGRKFGNTIQYPATIVCEVIDWGTPANFAKRGPAVSMAFVEVYLPDSVNNVREAVYSQLIVSYPELVI